MLSISFLLARSRFCLGIAALVTNITFASPHTAPARADESALRVAIIGDSTVASYPNPPADRPDLTGWGQVFGELFNQMGDEGSADFGPSATDRTHSSRKGALAMAGIVADGIERTDSMLGKHRRAGSD